MQARSFFAALALFSACAAPGTDIKPLATDFAVVQIQLEGWTWNEELLGLQRFVEGQFGPHWQIDLDRKLFRFRIERPMTIDVKSIAANVIKNNMGVGGIELQARASVQGQSVKLADTGQTLPVKNGPAGSTKPWQVFAAEGWEEGQALTLVWVEERDQPTANR